MLYAPETFVKLRSDPIRWLPPLLLWTQRARSYLHSGKTCDEPEFRVRGPPKKEHLVTLVSPSFALRGFRLHVQSSSALGHGSDALSRGTTLAAEPWALRKDVPVLIEIDTQYCEDCPTNL